VVAKVLREFFNQIFIERFVQTYKKL